MENDEEYTVVSLEWLRSFCCIGGEYFSLDFLKSVQRADASLRRPWRGGYTGYTDSQRLPLGTVLERQAINFFFFFTVINFSLLVITI